MASLWIIVHHLCNRPPTGHNIILKGSLTLERMEPASNYWYVQVSIFRLWRGLTEGYKKLPHPHLCRIISHRFCFSILHHSTHTRTHTKPTGSTYNLLFIFLLLSLHKTSSIFSSSSFPFSFCRKATKKSRRHESLPPTHQRRSGACS